MSTEAEEASKVLATEQEFWNGRSSNQEEAHEDTRTFGAVAVLDWAHGQYLRARG